MITLRPAQQRGATKLSWLDSRHTFSFGDYHDPQHMGFSDLRVINEDRVIPGAGFPTHSHRDMEIVTYVLEGAVAHKDSAGTSTTIRPGEVQRMSAGTGISHSECNASQNEPVHFLQIWIVPDKMGLVPGYEQKAFSLRKHPGTGTLVASKDGRDGSITVHQNVDVWAAHLSPEEQAVFRLKPNRRAWIQMARGAGILNGTLLGAGDGAAASQEGILEIKAVDEAKFLMFDLA
jgi:redox-sensitive bicupin YhaK (pirin superfamily)